MVVPVGSDVHEVDVVALAELLIALLAEVDVGGLQTLSAERLLASLSAGLLIVTESYYLYAGDVGKACHSTGTTHAETYEAYAHNLQLGSGEAERMLLTNRALGSFNYKCTLVPMGLGRG
jgi:hypothetical protein